MPSQPTIPRICPQCGKPFLARLADINCGRSRHCSKRCGYASRRRPPTERFWEKVDTSGECWLWLGQRSESGHGRFYDGTHQVQAHRFAYEQAHGPIPDGIDCLHRCDNPPCVRPDHLFLGTQADNMHDMARKGRAAAGETHASKRHPEKVARGERSGLSRLTDETVREIRRLHATGATQKSIAERFGISRANVCLIVNRKAWRHL